MHDLTEKCGLRDLPDVRLPARRGPQRAHDRARLRRRRRLPLAPTPTRSTSSASAPRRSGRMKSLGWKVVKMSGANFKVWVPLPDGRRCGIDVFGSFHIGESFYVTGSLHRHPGPLRAAALRDGHARGSGDHRAGEARGGARVHLRPGLAGPGPGLPLRPRPGRRTRGWTRGSARPRRRLRFWHDFYKSPDAARVPTEPSAVRALGAGADGRRRARRRASCSTSAPAPAATRRTSPATATG